MSKNMIELIQRVEMSICSIVRRYNQIKSQIKKLDKDYLIDLDNIPDDLDGYSFTFGQQEIEIDYYMSSFGENFDQHYLIPYEVLYLEDNEIADYVDKCKNEYYEHREKLKIAELARLKKRLEELGGE